MTKLRGLRNFWVFFWTLQKTNGPKTRLPKATKSSNSAQEDIEIEIAEVLYGLMKQSQSSKKEDSAGNPLPKLKSEDVNGFSTDTKPSVSPQIASFAQSQSQTTVLPDPLVGVGGYFHYFEHSIF